MATQYNVTLLTIDKDTGHTIDVNEEIVVVSKRDEENGYVRLHVATAILQHFPHDVVNANWSKDLSGWTVFLPHLPLFWKIITSFDKDVPE